jgi:hypothetical protein
MWNFFTEFIYLSVAVAKSFDFTLKILNLFVAFPIECNNKDDFSYSKYDLRDVPSLKEVRGLEYFLVGDAVLLGGCQEGLDVLHQEEGRALEPT